MKNKKTMLVVLGIAVVAISLIAWLVFTSCICVVPDCNKFRTSGSEHCAVHTCLLDGCAGYKIAGKSYCYDLHGCRSDGCSNFVEEADGKLHYCAEHKCAVAECRAFADKGEYCFQHICTHPDCNLPTNEAYSRCAKHS